MKHKIEADVTADRTKDKMGGREVEPLLLSLVHIPKVAPGAPKFHQNTVKTSRVPEGSLGSWSWSCHFTAV